MSIYDRIAFVYEKWSSGDVAYAETFQFYTSALMQMTQGCYLELGIGTGRISAEVIRHVPITIWGIDSSQKMLQQCEEKYRKILIRRGELFLEKGDFIHLAYYEKFDGIIMPFRTIGHVMNDLELEEMFQGIFRALKPGGWFLFDHYMFQQEWAETHNNKEIVMYTSDDFNICDKYQYDFENKKMYCEIRVNGTVQETFDFRWIEPTVFRTMAKKTGFEIVSLMGEFDGTAWTSESLEQIWLLKKPGNLDKGKLPEFISTNDKD